MILVYNNRLVRVRGKANDSETLRDDPLIVMRHGLADRWFAKYRKEMYKQLSAQILESSKLVAGGSTEPTTDAMEVRWTERLLRVKRPMVAAMVRSGTELTDAVQFGKSMNYFPGVLGPDVNPFALKGKADPIGLEVIGYDSDDVFLHQAQTQNVEAYLQATSKSETATSRKNIDKLYRDANSYWDEELQRGFTPQQMARQMREQGLADSVHRANLMARTTTMWSYNEGAHQSYINAGIQAETWVVAQDDVLCEFCVQMDGQTVRTEEPFVPAGTELPGLDGGILNIPTEWPISHPPLHPMCRCTLVPVVLPQQAVASTKAGDKLREEYTKKVEDGTLKEARARRAKLLRARRKKKPKPLRKKPPTKKEPSPFAETKKTKKTLEKKKPKPKAPRKKAVRKKPVKKKIEKVPEITQGQAVDSYQNYGYQDINSYLRKTEKIPDEVLPTVKKKIKVLDSAMKPSDAQMYLQRGDGSAVSSKIFELPEVASKLPNKLTADDFATGKAPGGESWTEFFREIFNGRVFKDSGFTSMTTDRAIAEQFIAGSGYHKTGIEAVIEAVVPKGTKLINVEAHSIMGAGESEFILARGTKFKINNVVVTYKDVGARGTAPYLKILAEVIP